MRNSNHLLRNKFGKRINYYALKVFTKLNNIVSLKSLHVISQWQFDVISFFYVIVITGIKKKIIVTHK